LAAKYLKVLIPYLVVLVDGILAVFWYLKEYLIVIKSCKYKGLVLLTILNVSMAIVLIRLIFKVGNLDFVKSSSYVLKVALKHQKIKSKGSGQNKDSQIRSCCFTA
jgi:CDP-diglyceride synthetase